MRKVIVVILMVAAMAACTSIDCPVKNLVTTNYSLKKGGGTKQDTLKTDTLWIKTTRVDGTDTLLLNALNGESATSFMLQISYTLPEDVFVTLLHDASGHHLLDTIYIKKENMPHFESVDCQASFFHKITDVRTTHNAIDSLVIHNPNVDYDYTVEHFYLYLKDEAKR
ncbi:MAG: alpha amylase [Prevotella sp.]|nr:alpha amylase [Prevotella sp.]